MENLSTFEKCKSIRTNLLAKAGEAIAFKANWEPETRLNHLDQVIKIIETWEKEGKYGSFKINPTDLTRAECEELGFQAWEKENPMLLIPIWIFPFLADEFESVSIFGNRYTKLSELDPDTRFGCIAYGIIPKDHVQVSSQTGL